MDTAETIERAELSLIAKAREGDIKAFSALVLLHQERLIHLGYSFLGNFEDARDVAQEAFVKAYQNLSSFKGNCRFFTWLYRIMMNQCKDFLRKKTVRKTLGVFSQQPDEEAEEKVAVDASTPLKRVLNNELENKITEALSQLPFQQRSVFALRYLEGMSLDEIAETMELTTGAVKAHLWQAGQKVKTRLREYLPHQQVNS